MALCAASVVGCAIHTRHDEAFGAALGHASGPGIEAARWTHTPADDIASHTDADGVVTTFDYDERRRMIEQTDGETHTTCYDYDGNDRRTRVTPAKGEDHATTYDWDPAGRLVEVAGPVGVAATYGYDRADNRTRQTDANGHSTLFFYDALNRLTGITYPAVAGVAAGETFGLDGQGNVESHTRGGVVTVTATYDALDRRLTESFAPVAADGLTGRVYAYDGNGNRTQVTETFAAGPPRIATWTHDRQERLIARVDGHGRTLGYDHDAQGNRRSRSGPEGTTQYAYNARHQLTQVTPPGQGGIAITPSPAGRLRAIDPGNGVLSQYSHDRAGRLTRIEHSAGGGTVAGVVYDLDSHGNRIAETVTQGAVTRSLGYGFDAADRLVRITAPDGETIWTLDGAGTWMGEFTGASDQAGARQGGGMGPGPGDGGEPGGGVGSRGGGGGGGVNWWPLSLRAVPCPPSSSRRTS